MPIVQVWATNDDMDTLRRLKAYLEYEQEREFEGKAYRVHTLVGRRKRLRRKNINDSYIYRQALNSFWVNNEEFILDFEKRDKY